MKTEKEPKPPVVVSLAERIENLSTKRQEIIRPILEHPRNYVLLSVRAMAKRLSTDPATIVRIVRGLGFESYKDFQRHLHDMSIAFATSLDTMQHGQRDPGTFDIVRASVEQDITNVQGLKNSLDSSRVTALAKRVHKARRILVFGIDLAAVLTTYTEYLFSLLGLPVFAATSAGRILHLARHANSQDLVLAVTFRRGLRHTVEGTEQAKGRGAYCVGIADTYLSPLGRICDEILLASVESTSYGVSYAAPISLINAVVTACGEHRHGQRIALVKEMAEEQRRGSRWYS